MASRIYGLALRTTREEVVHNNVLPVTVLAEPQLVHSDIIHSVTARHKQSLHIYNNIVSDIIDPIECKKGGGDHALVREEETPPEKRVRRGTSSPPERLARYRLAQSLRKTLHRDPSDIP